MEEKNWQELLADLTDDMLEEIIKSEDTSDEKRKAAQRELIRRRIERENQYNAGKLPDATLRERFFNFFVDYIIIGNFLVMFFAVEDPTDINNLHYWMLFLFLYFLISESIFGKTLGKLLTNTKVVDQNGNAPTFWQILIRSIVRFIPFEAISFLFYDDRRFWHDVFSKTRVVKHT